MLHSLKLKFGWPRSANCCWRRCRAARCAILPEIYTHPCMDKRRWNILQECAGGVAKIGAPTIKLSPYPHTLHWRQCGGAILSKEMDVILNVPGGGGCVFSPTPIDLHTGPSFFWGTFQGMFPLKRSNLKWEFFGLCRGGTPPNNSQKVLWNVLCVLESFVGSKKCKKNPECEFR